MIMEQVIKGDVYNVTFEEMTMELKYIGYIYEVIIKYKLENYFFTQIFMKENFLLNIQFSKLLCSHDDDYLTEYKEIIKNYYDFLCNNVNYEKLKKKVNLIEGPFNITDFNFTFRKNYLFIQGTENIYTFDNFNLPTRIEKKEIISLEDIPEMSFEHLKKYYEESISTIQKSLEKTDIKFFKSMKSDISEDFVFRYVNLINKDLIQRANSIDDMKEKIEEFYLLKEKLPELEDDIYLFRKNINVNYKDIIKKNQLVEHYVIPFSVINEPEFIFDWSIFSVCCHYIIKIPKNTKIFLFERTDELIEATIYPGYLTFSKILKINYKGNDVIVIMCNYEEYNLDEINDMLELYKKDIKLDLTKKFNKEDYADFFSVEKKSDDDSLDYELGGGKLIKEINKNNFDSSFYKKKYLKYKEKYNRLKYH